MSFIKKVKVFDLIIVALILLIALTAILTFTGKRQTSSKQIEATFPVRIEAIFTGVTITSENSIFKVGDETFITIRNVPYTKLKIEKVNFERKKVAIPANNPQHHVIVDDPSCPFQWDFLVTVSDVAKMTKDGAVVGGNKIKIGLPVVFEGLDYRVSGIITNITKVEEEPEEIIEDIEATEDDNI